MKKIVTVAFLSFFFLLLLTGGVYAWIDDFQDGDSAGWSPEEAVATTGGTYVRCLCFHCGGYDIGYYTTEVTSPELDGVDYIAFRSAKVYIKTCSESATYAKVCVINETGYELCSSNLYSIVDGTENYGFEIKQLNNYVYLFINGTLVENMGELKGEIKKVRFRLKVRTCDWGWYSYWYLDDFTTTGYHLAIGEENYDHNTTEFDDEEIDVEWIVNLYYDEGSTFKIIVKRLTTGAVINETDITTIANSYGCGVTIYNRTELLGNNYGLYLFELTKDGQLMSYDWLYYIPPGETSSLAFDKETYASGETATITYDIANPDFSSHNYYIKILDIYGNEKKRWHITKESGSVTFNTNELDAGTYYAVLVQYSEPVDLAYDMMQVEEKVNIEGVSYDAKNECVLGGANVNALQGTVWHNTTTDATTGYYNLTDFIVDETIQMNASKANYTHNNFSFTPLQSGLYEINLFLLPDEAHINVTAPAIVGLTQLYPFHQNISYATVNIWNETWNASTTTNSMGYFAFENLSPGTYYLNATHIKCKPSETYEVNLSSGEIEYVYILMHGLYNLTVKARDVGTHATIFNFRATLNDGEQTKETTSGWLNFTNVEYGIHKVEVGANGYYSAIEYVYVYRDVEKVVYLTPLETAITSEPGVGISYPPHQVEFACVDLFGNPLPNVYVEATPISTTTGAVSYTHLTLPTNREV